MGDRRRIYRTLDTEAPGVDFRRPVRCPACALHFEAFLEASHFFAVG